jgi:hypothetical protein
LERHRTKYCLVIMRTCIGIICIGEEYLKEFEETFKPSVVKYAERHGYDLKIFTDFLDSENTDGNCISFQKCLVPSALSEYDTVVVMDADIWMTDSAPRVPSCEKIGIVDEMTQVPISAYKSFWWTTLPKDYYSLGNFTIDTDKLLNTGFMVCKPKDHAKFLKDVYDKYIRSSPGNPRKFHYEQTCLGYELQTQNMFEPLSNAWNFIYAMNKIGKIPFPRDVYGVHFAGVNPYYIRRLELGVYLSTQTTKSVFRWGIRK